MADWKVLNEVRSDVTWRFRTVSHVNRLLPKADMIAHHRRHVLPSELVLLPFRSEILAIIDFIMIGIVDFDIATKDDESNQELVAEVAEDKESPSVKRPVHVSAVVAYSCYGTVEKEKGEGD